jgi:hypothetical protein
MSRERVKLGLDHVGLALREPAEFATAWHTGRAAYPWPVWLALLLTAIAGTTTYGMTMGLLGGPGDVLLRGIVCTLSAGLAWSIALPALYILNSLSGSRLRASTTLLAALVTVSWGGLAMIASIPINWFFTVALSSLTAAPAVIATSQLPGLVWLVNVIVFAGVGVAMIDVFGRVMRKLEPARGRAPTWCLILVGLIGTELFYAFHLFDFGRLL